MNTLKKTTLVVAMTYALSGCATMDDQDRTKAEGAGVGAVLGGLIGLAVGGKKGAAIGAVLGAGAGVFVGGEVAKRKQQYASTEEAIAGEMQQTEIFTQSVRAENHQLEQDIDIYNEQIASLNANIQSGKESRSSLTTQKNKMQARHNAAKKSLSAVQNELQVVRTLHQEFQTDRGDSAELQEWQGKIGKLEKEKSILKENIDTLNTMQSNL